MITLWDHVPEEHRGQVDYEAVLQETIQQGLPSPRKWQAKDFIVAVRSLIGVAKPEGFPQTKERK